MPVGHTATHALHSTQSPRAGATPAVGAAVLVWILFMVVMAAGAGTIVEARLSTAGDYLTLVFYCLLATSSFLYLELYAVFSPDAASSRLKQLRTWLDTHLDQVTIAIFLLLGFWLAGKSIYLLVS